MGGLIKVNLLKQGHQVTKVNLKREIALFTCEKGLEDLYCMTNVYLVGVYRLKGFPEGAHQLDAHERLGDASIDVVKHQSDNGRVKLQPKGIRGVTKRWRFDYEMIKKTVKLKKNHNIRSPCRMTMDIRIVDMSNKLCRDRKTRHES